jgi:hypothetical protein
MIRRKIWLNNCIVFNFSDTTCTFWKTQKIDILLNVTFLFIPSISHNFQSKSLMKYAVLSVFFLLIWLNHLLCRFLFLVTQQCFWKTPKFWYSIEHYVFYFTLWSYVIIFKAIKSLMKHVVSFKCIFFYWFLEKKIKEMSIRKYFEFLFQFYVYFYIFFLFLFSCDVKNKKNNVYYINMT